MQHVCYILLEQLWSRAESSLTIPQDISYCYAGQMRAALSL